MSTVNSYCNSVTEVLDACGWTPERHVDLSSIEKIFIERGFQMHAVLRPVIANFNGLQLHSSANDWLTFDAEWAAMTYTAKSLRFLESITGGPLCPMGQFPCAGFFGNAIGEIFGLDVDWLLVNRAPDIEAFFKAILLRDKAAWQTIWLEDGQKPEHMR